MSDIDISTVKSTVEEVVGTETVQTAETYLQKISDFISHPVVKTILVVLLCLLVGKIILVIVNRTLDKMKLEPTACKFFRSVFQALIYAIVILVGIGTLGVEVSSLVALVSVCGAALALAAQNALANFFGGILLMGTKPFLVGDYISTTAGEGTVLEIGLLNTQLKTADNRIVTIPNGTISAATITNYSRGGTRRIELDFSVSYHAPVDHVKEVMMRVISSHPMALNEPEPPFARITAFAESSITYTARVWCKESDYWSFRFDLLENMKKAFDAEGISIPYTQIDVHLLDGKESATR